MIRNTVRKVFFFCGVVLGLVLPASKVFAESFAPVEIVVQDLGQRKTLVGNVRTFRVSWFVAKVNEDDKIRTIRVTGKLEVLFSDNVLREFFINIAAPGDGPPATEVQIPVPFGVTPGFYRSNVTVTFHVLGRVTSTREFAAPGLPAGSIGVGDPGKNPPVVAIAEGVLIRPCDRGSDCVDVRWAAGAGKNIIKNFIVSTSVTYQPTAFGGVRSSPLVTRSSEQAVNASTRQTRFSLASVDPSFKPARIKVSVAAEYASPELSKSGEKQGTMGPVF